MNLKNSKNFWWIVGSVLIALVFLLPFVLPDYRNFVERIIREYPAFAPITIVLMRFLTIVVAPLSGTPVAFVSIALLPWQEAFLYNFIGGYLGGLTAFFIARRFRERVVARFAPLKEVHQWQERLSGPKQFWVFAAIRFFGASAADFISYAAGLSKISFRTFLAATLIVDLPATLVFFYLGGIAVQYSVYLFLFFILLLWVSAGVAGIAARGRNKRPL